MKLKLYYVVNVQHTRWAIKCWSVPISGSIARYRLHQIIIIGACERECIIFKINSSNGEVCIGVENSQRWPGAPYIMGLGMMCYFELKMSDLLEGQ